MKDSVVVVSPVVPYPSHSGNSMRVAQICELYRDLGYDVHFILCPIKPIADRRKADVDLKNQFDGKYFELNNGVKYEGNFIQLFIKYIQRFFPLRCFKIHDFLDLDGFISNKHIFEFKQIIADINPRLVIFEYALLSKLADSLPKKVIKILDTHDKFTNRNQLIRQSNGKGLWWSLTQSQEKLSITRMNIIFAIQKHEANWFKKLITNTKTSVMTVDIIAPPTVEKAVDGENLTIGFIGSNNHHNEEGIVGFLKEHWINLLSHFPDLKLLIAGTKYDNDFLLAQNGVFQVGKVEDLGDFYRECSIIINPCLAGSGLKIKTVEAMSYGKAVVTTPKGGEGLEEAYGNGLFSYELDSSAFFYKCYDLLHSFDYRIKHGNLSIAYIQKKNNLNRKLLESILEIDKD